MGILQARILEWVTMPSSRGSSQPGDQTQISCIASGFFTIWAAREAKTARFQTPAVTNQILDICPIPPVSLPTSKHYPGKAHTLGYFLLFLPMFVPQLSYGIVLFLSHVEILYSPTRNFTFTLRTYFWISPYYYLEILPFCVSVFNSF